MRLAKQLRSGFRSRKSRAGGETSAVEQILDLFYLYKTVEEQFLAMNGVKSDCGGIASGS